MSLKTIKAQKLLFVNGTHIAMKASIHSRVCVFEYLPIPENKHRQSED